MTAATATRARRASRRTSSASRRSSTAAKRADAYQLITDQVVSMLEAGTAPWRKPWNTDAGAPMSMPMSMSTERPYRGINPFILAVAAQAEGYRSPWWGTFKQINDQGGRIIKGQRHTKIVFWTILDKVDEETGEKLRIPLLRIYQVFNAEQTQGLPDRFYTPAPQPRTQHDAIEECEASVRSYLATGPSLHLDDDAAYYRFSTDSVHMPGLDRFDAPEEYYSALFHELTHSTGHASRLNRDGIVEGHRFGDELYSKEELIAEMGASFLAGLTGIATATLPNSAAYLAGWIRVLRGDAKLVVQAAAAAQKAADLILGVTFDNAAEDE